jgi:ATP-dependent RNA helicase DeaD
MPARSILDDHSLIDLPSALPDEVLAHLKTVWCAGRQGAPRAD